VTGQDYEKAFQEEDIASAESGNKKITQKQGSKRYSSREKKPVTIDDLGYVDRDKGRKGGKGSFASSEGYQKCERLLSQLKKHSCAGPFLSPVIVPGYTDVIKEPMDISTVERKLKSGAYPSSYHFALDIRKIWSNSWSYNQPGSELYNLTTEISNYFEMLMKDVGDVQFVTEENTELQELKKQVNKVAGTLRKFTGTSAGAVPTKTAPGSTPKAFMDKPMTAQEKALLRQNIMKLPQDKLQGVISIIQDTIDTSKNKEVLEFDIDALPTRKCRELDQYVRKNLPAVQKSSKKKSKGKTKAARPKTAAAPPAVAPGSVPEERKQPEQKMPPQVLTLERGITMADVQPAQIPTMPHISMNLAAAQPEGRPVFPEEKKATSLEKHKLSEPSDDESESKSGMRV